MIEEINRDHVMLRYQGKIERLSLAEEERSTVAVTNKKAVSDEAKQAVAEPAASAPVEIPTAVRQALAKDPQKIFNYIQLTPVRREGCRLCSEAGGRSFSVRCQRFQGRRYRHCAKSAGFH